MKRPIRAKKGEIEIPEGVVDPCCDISLFPFPKEEGKKERRVSLRKRSGSIASEFFN